MMFRYCIISFRLALLLVVGVVAASAQKAPSAKPFERFDGCVLAPDEWPLSRANSHKARTGKFSTFEIIMGYGVQGI
jgi:hypothetical protein